MATDRQINYIIQLQRRLGCPVSTVRDLMAFDSAKASLWIGLLKLGVNPNDLVVAPVDMSVDPSDRNRNGEVVVSYRSPPMYADPSL